MISIRLRILSLAGVALFGVASAFFIEYQDIQKKIQYSENTLQILNDVQSLSKLVHSLQKERGLSAGHIVGRNETLYPLFLIQRKITDGQLAELSTAKTLQAQMFVKDFSFDLSAVRKRIDSGLIQWIELRDFYTSSLQQLLDLMLLQVIPLNYANDISHDLQLLTAITITHENIGLIRATLNRGYQQGQLSKNELIYLSHQYSNFIANLRTFDVIANAHFNKTANSKEFIEIKTQAFHSVVTQVVKVLNARQGAILGSPVLWWREATRVLDTMTKVEDAILERIEHDLLEDKAYYKDYLYWYGVFAFLVLTAVILLTIFTALRILKALSILLLSLDAVEQTQNYGLRIFTPLKDEFSQVSSSINSLLSYTEKLIKDLTQTLSELTRKQEIIKQEEQIARHVFESITASNNTNISTVQFWCQPMKTFSGDLILSAKLPCNGTRVLLCDFTGHGLPAALGAIPISFIFSALSQKKISLEILISEINKKLCDLLPTNMFCCMSGIDIDADNTNFRLWNSGLPDVLLLNDQGQIKQRFSSLHLPLGIMMIEEDELHCISGTLSSNDSLYIYSDGLIEAENSVGKFLGQAGFEQLLELSIMKKQDSLPAIKIGLTNYVGSTPPTDDISLVQIQGSASL